MTEVVVYPLFSDCQDYTLDQYWRDVFFNCACNKFPRGMRYDSRSNSITIRPAEGDRITTETIILESRNPENVYLSMMDIFQNILRLRSSSDLRSQKKACNKDDDTGSPLTNLDCEWKKIRPRSVQDNLLMKFARRMEIEYELSEKDGRFLWTLIRVGFHSKKLSRSEDVIYSDRRIERIEGLEFDDDLGEFILTRECRASGKTDKLQTRNKFFQAVDRFIGDCRKRGIKLNGL